MLNAIKTKVLVYICLVHVGLVLSLVALFREGSLALASPTFGLMAVGIGLMYGSFLFAALSIWIPMRPWITRYARARAWRTWILTELPTILSLIPVLMTVLKILKSAWGEIKTHQENGELTVKNLSNVAQKFAEDAEALSKDPSVERIRSRLG